MASRFVEEISSSHKELSRAFKSCSIEQCGIGATPSQGSRNHLAGVQSPVVLENPEPCLSPPLASWRLEGCDPVQSSHSGMTDTFFLLAQREEFICSKA